MKALAILDPRAAFVDVGSERMHVSIAGDTPVVFGTVTTQLHFSGQNASGIPRTCSSSQHSSSSEASAKPATATHQPGLPCPRTSLVSAVRATL